MWTAARACQDLFTDNNNTQCSKQMMNITNITCVDTHYNLMICNNIQTQINWIAIKSGMSTLRNERGGLLD